MNAQGMIKTVNDIAALIIQRESATTLYQHFQEYEKLKGMLKRETSEGNLTWINSHDYPQSYNFFEANSSFNFWELIDESDCARIVLDNAVSDLVSQVEATLIDGQTFVYYERSNEERIYAPNHIKGQIVTLNLWPLQSNKGDITLHVVRILRNDPGHDIVNGSDTRTVHAFPDEGFRSISEPTSMELHYTEDSLGTLRARPPCYLSTGNPRLTAELLCRVIGDSYIQERLNIK